MKHLIELLNKLRKRCNDKQKDITAKIDKFDDEYVYVLKSDILNFFEFFEDYQDIADRIMKQAKEGNTANEDEEQSEELRFGDKINIIPKIKKIDKVEKKEKIIIEDDRQYIEDLETLDKKEFKKIVKDLLNLKNKYEGNIFSCHLMYYLKKNRLKFKDNSISFFSWLSNKKDVDLSKKNDSFIGSKENEDIKDDDEDIKFEDFK